MKKRLKKKLLSKLKERRLDDIINKIEALDSDYVMLYMNHVNDTNLLNAIVRVFKNVDKHVIFIHSSLLDKLKQINKDDYDKLVEICEKHHLYYNTSETEDTEL